MQGQLVLEQLALVLSAAAAAGYKLAPSIDLCTAFGGAWGCMHPAAVAYAKGTQIQIVL